MRILIVEDEPKVAAFLQKGLDEQGYEVEVVYDGQMGKRKALQEDFDLIILDVILPYINGLQLCKQIKQEKSHVPVLMLSALGTMDDKLTGFEEGADDYLIKPFDFKELLARIRALLKRSNGDHGGSNKLVVADLELDLMKKVARRGGIIIDLTTKEFLFLEFLMRNRDKVVSRAEIAEKVWEITFDTGTNVVDVYVNILRKKIDRDHAVKLIKTRIGMGYMLSDTA
ncbi:response regulator transcription factor [Cryomorpha ignava]|uniref:Response regulator transcription factor n=1 Tax=Cryomorpha ignava TaxID=101383 RepID=A0A7K3WT44_9FLAO|nr:response regulator transcription factor [Cryomorpha ignava]NEN24857.1 response regulator transcription factor [Cryomorpha ignava]